MSILIAPDMLVRVIYAILIPLYNYPQKSVIKARFTPFFVPRAKWVEASGGIQPDRQNEIKKPDKDWLIGLRHYFKRQFPGGQDDPRRLGFAIGSQIVGLYLAEMLLKYALDARSIRYPDDHNLEGLFRQLPVADQAKLRTCHERILHSQPGHAWDFERSIDSLLGYFTAEPVYREPLLLECRDRGTGGCAIRTEYSGSTDRFLVQRVVWN